MNLFELVQNNSTVHNNSRAVDRTCVLLFSISVYYRLNYGGSAGGGVEWGRLILPSGDKG